MLNAIRLIIRHFHYYTNPREIISACIICMLFIDSIFLIVLSNTEKASIAYDTSLALLTGVTASFTVAIIVEMSNNFKFNKLAWHELDEYYHTLNVYEREKRKAMESCSSRMINESDCSEEKLNAPNDYIRATWLLLPKVMPVVKKTLESKKAYLLEEEIEQFEEVVFLNYEVICGVIRILIKNKLLLNSIVNPHEEYLSYLFPKNILNDIPDWMKKKIATNESLKAIERIVDIIMTDESILSEYINSFDISSRVISSIGTIDDEYEEMINKKLYDEYFQQTKEELEHLISLRFSISCKGISEGLDELARIACKNPIYGEMIHKSMSQKLE